MSPVTVVVPSYFVNSYSETLAALLQQSVPPKEIIVVRNGANRDDDQILSDHRVCFLRTTGLNAARNHGLELARGEIIAFTDDDGIPDAHWVENIQKVHAELEHVPVIGGRIDPIWPDNNRLPEWLKGIFLEYLTLLDYSPDLKPVHPADWIGGVNLSFKSWIFDDSSFRFDPDLDRKGMNLLSNGETELFERIRLAGHEIFYSPQMLVYHRIPESRMTPHFFVERAYWQGISDYLVDRKLHRTEMKLRIERIQREFIQPSLPFLGNVQSESYESLLALCRVQHAIGYLEASFTDERTDFPLFR